jgi:hypothetical protein
MAGVAHEPIERPVKDHRHRGAVVGMQRQRGQGREPDPADQEAVHLGAAGSGTAECDGNVSGDHPAPPHPAAIAFVPCRSARA